MKIRFLSLVLSVSAFAACSASPGATGGSSSSSSSGGSTDGSTATTTGGAGDIDGGGSEERGDASSGDAGGGIVIVENLAITASAFRNAGRLGDTISVTVSGTDPTGTTSAAHLRFTNAAGTTMKAVDTDFDGVVDAPEATYRFATSTLGKTSFDGTITIPSTFKPSSAIAKVYVSLENEAGGRSHETETTLTAQALAHVGDGCDALKITSRCEEGAACAGTPATCQSGTAPALSKVGYFNGASPKMLFLGTDADEDIRKLTVEFLDSAGNPKSVYITGDAADGVSASSIDIDARLSASGAAYLVSVQPAASFATQVAKIAVTAQDIIGRDSTRLVTSAAALPTRTTGQTCDSDGFDVCASTTVCAPGIRGAANTCKAATGVRTEKCSAFAALDPSKGLTKAYGDTAGVSLWDAPTGCVGNDATGRPEAAIPLHLASNAATLTISTAVPETSFDTAVYLIPACAATSAGALGCNDDAKGYASTLTLTDVPAGDYTIVVESVQPRGGHFGLSVAAN